MRSALFILPLSCLSFLSPFNKSVLVMSMKFSFIYSIKGDLYKYKKRILAGLLGEEDGV
jgi:hypothetical protein